MNIPRAITLVFLCGTLLSACGVKLPPSPPQSKAAAANFDCSIYDQDCAVTDPQYDAACDPALPKRPAICELWNQKYEKARLAWRAEQARKEERRRELIEAGKDEDKIKDEELQEDKEAWQYGVTP